MNTYTFQEVMQYVMENDVKFIRLAFCDIFGTQKNISIMPRELSRAFREGISIDASSIRGFANANRAVHAVRAAVASVAGARCALFLRHQVSGRHAV